MSPLDLDVVNLSAKGFELEILEKGSDPLYGALNQAIRFRVGLAQVKQKGSKVRSIGSKELVVVHLCSFPHWRRGTSIVHVVESPSTEALADPRRKGFSIRVADASLSPLVSRREAGCIRSRVFALFPIVGSLFGWIKTIVCGRRQLQLVL